MKLKQLISKKFILAGILVFVIISSFILSKLGVFSIDESIILLGFNGLYTSGNIKIFNDYENFEYPELNAYKGIVNGKELFVKYPPLYFYLALPIFITFGPIGLLFLNLISAVLVILIFYKLVGEITGDETVAVKSSVLLIFTTFFFEYSIAIWPHMLTLLLGIAAIYLIRSGLTADGEKDYMLYYSGLFAGIAVGVRASAVILFFLLVFLIILESKHHLKRLGLLLLGAYSPLGLISFINTIRFGALNPLANSFEGQIRYSTVFLAVPVVLIFSTLLGVYIYRSAINSQLSLKKLNGLNIAKNIYCKLGICFSGGIVVIFLLAKYYKEFLRLAHNFAAYVINTYFLPRISFEGAGYMEPGIIHYNGVIKKALLQSCPFLIVIFIAPLILKKIKAVSARDRRLMYLICYGYPIFFALFNFHGGMGYNLRYFLDILPWGVLLTVLCFDQLSFSGQLVEVFVLSTVLFALLLSFTPDNSIASLILVVLVPTIVAFLLLFAVLVYPVISKHGLFRIFLGILVVVALSLGFSFEYFKDLPAVLTKRSENLYKSRLVGNTVPDKSFLFVFWGYKDPLAMVKLNKNITVADFNLSRGKNPFPLIEKALSAGRQVYFYGEGIHPELLEVLRVEYQLDDVSKDIIPVYRIQRRSKLY